MPRFEWYAFVADADYRGGRRVIGIGAKTSSTQVKQTIATAEREYSAWPGRGNVVAVGPYRDSVEAMQHWKDDDPRAIDPSTGRFRSLGERNTGKNPALPKVGSPITGYAHANGRIVAEGKRGSRFTGWVITRTVEHYRGTFVSGKIEAVVVEFHPSTRTKPYYGAGLSLGAGMLFRGEVVGYDEDEARRQAKVEAEYWLQRDAEDEQDSDEDFEMEDDE